MPSRGPTSSAGEELGELGWFDGYLTAMEWVFLSGGFAEPGPARVWARPRMPLVEGEDNTPLTRVLLAADSGNGLSTLGNPRYSCDSFGLVGDLLSAGSLGCSPPALVLGGHGSVTLRLHRQTLTARTKCGPISFGIGTEIIDR